MNTTDCSVSDGFPRARLTLALIVIWCIATGASSCSSGSGEPASAPVAEVFAPAISGQPVDQSIPMGLSATFTVTATGSSLQYQWARNGAAIAAATGSSYATPATTFDDSGANFSVTVSNPVGVVTSNAASLTVTARAPMLGDLRFQQVDAPSTVYGWGNAGAGLSTNLLGRSAEFYSPSLGTSFYAGSGDCGATPVLNGTGCTWFFSVVPYVPTDNSPVLTAGYASDSYENFQADLQSPVWPAFNNGVSPSSSSSVITSIDFEPSNALFALSWIQSGTVQGFTLFQNNITVANLQAEATREGANSRVITAISNNGGQITYFAYSWDADLTTIYEAQIATASPSGAPAAAASLAAQGYIITAMGNADDAGDILFVGTKVQGDSMPRAFIAAQSSSQFLTLHQGGYANVGVSVDLSQSNPYTFFGER